MTEHAGLPVAGYKPQHDRKVAAVNHNKTLEERVLRQIEDLRTDPDHDRYMLEIGEVWIKAAFMWINRAVFQPGRVRLPEDGAPPTVAG